MKWFTLKPTKSLSHYLILAAVTFIICVLPLGSLRRMMGQTAYVTTAITALNAPGDTQIVTGAPGVRSYVVNWGLSVGSSATTGQTVQWIATTGNGAGTVCNTGPGVTAVTGVVQLGSGNTANVVPANIFYSGAPVFVGPLSSALCLRLTGGQAVGGWVTSYPGP